MSAYISALIVGEIVLTGILSVSQNVWFLGGLIVVVSLVWWFTPLSVPGVFKNPLNVIYNGRSR